MRSNFPAARSCCSRICPGASAGRAAPIHDLASAASSSALLRRRKSADPRVFRKGHHLGAHSCCCLSLMQSAGRYCRSSLPASSLTSAPHWSTGLRTALVCPASCSSARQSLRCLSLARQLVGGPALAREAASTVADLGDTV